MSRRLSRRRRRAAGVDRQPDPRAFAVRHRFVLVLLLATVPVLAGVGIARDVPIGEIVIAALLLVALGAAGLLARSPGLAAAVVGMGLITAAGILVRFLDSGPTSNYAFFLAIAAIAIYRDRRALILGVVYVIGYHLFAAIFGFAETLEATGDEATRVSWPALQITLTVVLALLLMAGWKVNNKALARAQGGQEGFRRAFELTGIGMGLLTPSGQFVEVNRALSDLLGQEPDRLIGANLRTVVNGYDLDRLGELWEEMADRPNEKVTAWLRCCAADGREIWSQLSLSLMSRTSRRPARVLLELSDGDEEYRKDQQHEAMLRERDDYVATIAEELVEPLEVILDLTGDPRPGHLGEIAANARRVAGTIEDLAVSARAEAPTLVNRVVDVRQLCEHALTGLPGAERIPLEVRAGELWADPSLVTRIIRTLVDTALRYGGPTVEVKTMASGPDTVIAVVDDGPEVPEDERERMFNADLRHGAATSPASVGLALTVARQVAREMDGDLEYRRSDGRNHFELRLPREPVRAVPEAATGPVEVSA